MDQVPTATCVPTPLGSATSVKLAPPSPERNRSTSVAASTTVELLGSTLMSRTANGVTARLPADAGYVPTSATGLPQLAPPFVVLITALPYIAGPPYPVPGWPSPRPT